MLSLADQKSSIWGVTLHASAGAPGLQAANRVAQDAGFHTIGVTVLTSHGEGQCLHIFNAEPARKSILFARDVEKAGCSALVCAPTEAKGIRDNLDRPHDMTIICPGVRPGWAQKNDQARVMTPKEALDAGADYLVIGRPITQPDWTTSRVAAARRIIQELEG